jgi:hypothetical protein
MDTPAAQEADSDYAKGLQNSPAIGSTLSQAGAGLASGLGAPRPSLSPAPGISPGTPAAAPTSQLADNPVVKSARNALFGKVTGDIFHSIAGGHYEDSIDPNTGKTVQTFVKASPGEWARNTVNAALLGMQGIGPNHGENTFTQGLLAGLTGGTKARMEQSEKQKEEAKQEAQQQYANQLKAKEDQRQDKKLSLDEQLNQVAIANHNQEMAARKIMMDTQAYSFSKEKGLDIAAPLIQHSQMSVEADKPLVEGYKSLGVEPVASNITEDQVNKYVADHPGATVSQIAAHVGTQTEYDPVTGKATVKDIYSIYPPMTKVPPALLTAMKGDGAEDPKSPLHNKYATLLAAKDGNMNTRDLLSIYRDQQNWEGIQAKSASLLKEQAQIREANSATYRNNMEAANAAWGVNDRKEGKEMSDVYTHYYDPKSDTLVGVDNLNTKDPKGNPLPLTPSEIKDREHKSDLLVKALTNQYQQEAREYVEKYHPKISDGKFITDDPQGAFMTNHLNNLGAALSRLHGVTTAKSNPDDVVPTTPNVVVKDNKGATRQFTIPKSQLGSFLTQNPTAEIVAPPPSEEGPPEERLIIKTQEGPMTMTRKDFLNRKKNFGPYAGTIASDAPEPWGPAKLGWQILSNAAQ